MGSAAGGGVLRKGGRGTLSVGSVLARSMIFSCLLVNLGAFSPPTLRSAGLTKLGATPMPPPQVLMAEDGVSSKFSEVHSPLGLDNVRPNQKM